MSYQQEYEVRQINVQGSPSVDLSCIICCAIISFRLFTQVAWLVLHQGHHQRWLSVSTLCSRCAASVVCLFRQVLLHQGRHPATLSQSWYIPHYSTCSVMCMHSDQDVIRLSTSTLLPGLPCAML